MIFPSVIWETVHPAWVQIGEKPLKSPAAGWVITTFSRITPDPTGTSAVLANAPDADAADGADAAGDELAASEPAELLPEVLHAATVVASRPSPAPAITARRGGLKSSSM